MRQNVFVGSISAMKWIFSKLCKAPEPIDFPQSIIDSGLLNRKVSKTTLSDAIEWFEKTGEPVFIKPVDTKLFDGILIKDKSNLSYFAQYGDPYVWVCKEIKILSEHRVYVQEGQLVYSCNYDGDVRINPNWDYVESLIKSYYDAPIAYTLDVAVLDDNSMTVIEVNDFWAIGGYGLYCLDYATALEARYHQIVNKGE